VYEEWEPKHAKFLEKVLASASIPVVCSHLSQAPRQRTPWSTAGCETSRRSPALSTLNPRRFTSC
jgi:hypothetical protein